MIITRSCDRCGTPYEASSKRSKYCSGTCRTRASRAGESGQVVQLHPDPVEHEGRNVAATRAELDTLDAVDSALGVTALTLAARLDDSSRETGNSVASISRELRAVMAEVRQAARPKSAVTDLRDVLAARRSGAG
jgi:hypothetical protein